MSQRITRKNVESLLPFFAETFGYHVATDYKDIGGLTIDNNPIYGGMVLQVYVNSSGGVSRPFGNNRNTPKDLYNMMHFAIHCKYAAQRLEESKT